MSCLTPEELAAAASGRQLGSLTHLDACEDCRRELEDQRAIRALASRMPAPTLPRARRDELAAEVMAHADRRFARATSHRFPIIAAAVAAACMFLVASDPLAESIESAHLAMMHAAPSASGGRTPDTSDPRTAAGRPDGIGAGPAGSRDGMADGRADGRPDALTGRTSDGIDGRAGASDERTADGRTSNASDGRTADGRTWNVSDGRTSDGRTSNADGRTSNADGRTASADARSSADGRTSNADGRTASADGRTSNADGRSSADRRTASADGRTASADGRTASASEFRTPSLFDLWTPATVAGANAQFSRGKNAGRDVVALRDGELTVDARATAPIEIALAGTGVHVAKAKVSVVARRGVIESVTVFAGSAQVTMNNRQVRIEAGTAWHRETLGAPVPPGAGTARSTAGTAGSAGTAGTAGSAGTADTGTGTAIVEQRRGSLRDVPEPLPVFATTAFREGWEALRSARFADAVAAFDRATDPVVAEDAAYWAAIAAERGGDRAGAILRLTAFRARFPESPRNEAARTALEKLAR